MLRRIVHSLVFISVLLFSGCSFEETAASSLSEELKMELKERQFGKIYDNASDFVHANVSREDFALRARLLVDAVENVDRDFNWQEDISLGRSFEIRRYDDSYTICVFRKAGSGEQTVRILMYWQVIDGKPALYDLAAVSQTENIGTVGRMIESR